MKLLNLFIGFLKVGMFAFGGSYGAIPLIRDVVLSYGWLDEESLTYMIAVSESTPGPIMVNLATYIGKSQAGFWGSVVATTAVVIPSFVVISIVSRILARFMKNRYVNGALGGLKPCIMGLIAATGIYMVVSACFVSDENTTSLSVQNLGITLFLFALIFITEKFFKKQLSPIALILISAVAGIIIF